MYKLEAKLPNGMKWITNCKSVMGLQRIAQKLGSESYEISINGSVVYAQRG